MAREQPPRKPDPVAYAFPGTDFRFWSTDPKADNLNPEKLIPVYGPEALAAVRKEERDLWSARFEALLEEGRAWRDMYVRAADYAGRSWARFGRLERRLQRLRFHMIDIGDVANLQRPETRLLAHAPFLERLRTQGRERGTAWLASHLPAVGRQASIDVRTCFG